jgi:hypothetical protein
MSKPKISDIDIDDDNDGLEVFFNKIRSLEVESNHILNMVTEEGIFYYQNKKFDYGSQQDSTKLMDNQIRVMIQYGLLPELKKYNKRWKEIRNNLENLILEHNKDVKEKQKEEKRNQKIKKMKAEKGECCFDIECSERIPPSEWTCPNCTLGPVYFPYKNQERMECLNSKCRCSFHWCAYIKDYDCENSPYHKNIIQ